MTGRVILRCSRPVCADAQREARWPVSPLFGAGVVLRDDDDDEREKKFSDFARDTLDFSSQSREQETTMTRRKEKRDRELTFLCPRHGIRQKYNILDSFRIIFARNITVNLGERLININHANDFQQF